MNRRSVGRVDDREHARARLGPLGGNGVPVTLDDETGDWVIGQSPAMRDVWDMIENAAETDVTVLAWGESGVGKEMIPRLLHRLSPRRLHAFIKVNCAALPLELLESELFGYERGAFTGAHRPKPGKFELANRGTIFLDEIGEMPLPLQAKLLHVLQDREFSRLGSEQNVRVDVRVVAATNKDLAGLVEQRVFRADLYYRLNVVNIRVPPLRQRRVEIPILVDHFLRRFGEQYRRPRASVSVDTMRQFMEYPWPGNIRELENIVKRIVVLRSESWVSESLGGLRAAAPSGEGPGPPRADAVPTDDDEELGLKGIARRAAADAEREALRRVLELVRWNRMEASRRLKVNYKTLLRKIEDHGLGSHPQRRVS